MQVIGAGFGRTGTLSLKHALERLGFRGCYHMQEAMRRRSHTRAWLGAARGESVDWRALFDGFEATVDFPASVYYRELMEAFPDALVLLSVRDPDSWYESTLSTIYRTSQVRWLQLVVPRMRDMMEAVQRDIWGGLFGGRFEERDQAIAVFKQWSEDVKAHVPAERLLVFQAKDGWEPLCAFLGVPVPQEPFPHVNERRSMMRILRAMQVAPWLGAGILVAALLWLALAAG